MPQCVSSRFWKTGIYIRLSFFSVVIAAAVLDVSDHLDSAVDVASVPSDYADPHAAKGLPVAVARFVRSAHRITDGGNTRSIAIGPHAALQEHHLQRHVGFVIGADSVSGSADESYVHETRQARDASSFSANLQEMSVSATPRASLDPAAPVVSFVWQSAEQERTPRVASASAMPATSLTFTITLILCAVGMLILRVMMLALEKNPPPLADFPSSSDAGTAVSFDDPANQRQRASINAVKRKAANLIKKGLTSGEIHKIVDEAEAIHNPPPAPGSGSQRQSIQASEDDEMVEF